MPYQKAKSMGDLIQIIENHDFAADVQKVMEHHKEMGAYETGDATGYITDFVISKMNKRRGTYR